MCFLIFSLIHGISQSIAGSIISTVMGYIMQQGSIGNLFSSSSHTDNDRIGEIQSALSSLIGGGGGELEGTRERGKEGEQLQQDHPLVQQVQQNTGIQDPKQAKEYTHKAVSLMKEHANNNPQGLHSLFSNFMRIISR